MSVWYDWRDAPAAEFGVIGDPIAHSLSPRMQLAAFEALGLPYGYLAIRVPNGEVSMALDHLRSLGYRGLNVTVPDKEAALRWAAWPDDAARQIGAANTLDLLSGKAANTDAPGFLDLLSQLEIDPPARILVVGAGGTARALALALHSTGYPFALFNRTAGRAHELLAALGIEAPVVNRIAVEGFDAVVNTTSAELHGEALDIDWRLALPGAAAIDMFYRSEPTDFLRKASEFGFRTLDGRAMLVAQGARSLEWWLGVEAPRSAMLNAIL